MVGSKDRAEISCKMQKVDVGVSRSMVKLEEVERQQEI